MRQKTDDKLTSRERLTRGLAYSAVGPVDVTRGAIGIGAHSVYAAATGLRRRYEQDKDARTAKRRRPHPLLLAGAAVLILAAGAAAFALIRRPSRPSPQPPSPRPPSVDVEPKP